MDLVFGGVSGRCSGEKQRSSLAAMKCLSLSREILNSRLHDSVWSLTDWFWCICRFIGGTVQIEVITLSRAKQTPLRDWFIFSCTEGRFKVSFEEKQLSPHGFSMQSSLLLCFYLALLEMRHTFQHGYEFLLLSGSTELMLSDAGADEYWFSVQKLCVMLKNLSRLLMRNSWYFRVVLLTSNPLIKPVYYQQETLYPLILKSLVYRYSFCSNFELDFIFIFSVFT